MELFINLSFPHGELEPTMPEPAIARHRWWKEASIYQIYPSSFCDSNGDGIGDIPGIISKLDYLHELGVDVIWLSPVYKSPQKDMGYDISDYQAIDPRYGSMADMDRLIAGLHARGMKLLMDLVVNHTSDQHAWFQESRSSLDNDKRKWYVWRDGFMNEKGEEGPPNNWRSVFGGSAWQYDEVTGQYYLHCFLPGQPDLNWEHPPVREAVHSQMKFWLDKGTDGFRMDVIDLISKPRSFADAPVVLPNERWQPADKLISNGPRLNEFLEEMGREVLSKYDVMTVGEMPWMTDKREALNVVGWWRGELDMIFQFDMITMDFGNNGRYSWPEKPWTLSTLKGALEGWQTFMIQNGGWNSVCLESHDQPRSVSRFVDRSLTDNDPVTRVRVAKMLATLEAGQCGTIYVYQGQELAMKNMPTHWPIEEYKDVETQNAYKEALEQAGRDESKMQDFMKALHLKARDHARIPVQWDSSSHAGFTTGMPWMRVNEDYPQWNAALQVPDEDSVFSFWKKVLQLRKQYKNVLIYGDFEMLVREDARVVAYRRTNGQERALVLLNFTNGPVEWEIPRGRRVEELVDERYRKLGNHGKLLGEGDVLSLRPFEALMFIK